MSSAAGQAGRRCCMAAGHIDGLDGAVLSGSVGSLAGAGRDRSLASFPVSAPWARRYSGMPSYGSARHWPTRCGAWAVMPFSRAISGQRARSPSTFSATSPSRRSLACTT